MLSVYSDDHRLHFGQSELVDGKLQPCFEMPSRADTVLARVKSQNLGEVIAPKDFGREPLLRIHDAAYLDFLQGAWARWTAEGHSGDLVSTTFPGRRLRRDGPIPTALMGELGYYSFDTEAPITAGTWQAIYSSAQVALTAQEHMRQGARNAFALCRPPGHHAGGDFMGGYCLNNAAIATQAFSTRAPGAWRSSMSTITMATAPRISSTAATTCCSPRSMAIRGSNTRTSSATPTSAAKAPARLQPQLSAGPWQRLGPLVGGARRRLRADRRLRPGCPGDFPWRDTKEDPISQFRLDSPDYLRMGERIARLGLPTLFVMEGGYAVEAIGINAVNVQGYEGAAR